MNLIRWRVYCSIDRSIVVDPLRTSHLALSQGGREIFNNPLLVIIAAVNCQWIMDCQVPSKQLREATDHVPHIAELRSWTSALRVVQAMFSPDQLLSVPTPRA